MTHELRRPLLFNVQPTKQRPPLGVVTQEESSRLQHKHRGLQRMLDEGSSSERQSEADANQTRDSEPVLPAGALPLVRSPRPTKKQYLPIPSKTPKYFRWTPLPPSSMKPLPPQPQTKPLASRGTPSPSPQVQRRQSSWKVVETLALASRANETMVSTRASSRGGSEKFEKEPGTAESVTPWKQGSVGSIEAPVTPGNISFLFDGPEPSPPRSTPSTPSTPGTVSVSTTPATPSVPSGSSMLELEHSRLTTPILLHSHTTGERINKPDDFEIKVEMVPPSLQRAETTKAGKVETPLQSSPSTPVVATAPETSVDPFQPPTSAAIAPGLLSTENQDEKQQLQQQELDEVKVTPMSPTLTPPSTPPVEETKKEADFEEKSTRPATVDDSLAVPIVLRKTGGGRGGHQPQQRVLMQHVLRGAVLRKYLHVNNIARRLRETELQVLRASVLRAGEESSRVVGRGVPPLPLARGGRKWSLERVDSVKGDPGGNGGPPSVLLRLSSVDKAITQTAKRMRLLSNASLPMLSSPTPSKGASLRTIGEGQKLNEPKDKITQRRRSDFLEGDESNDPDGATPLRAKVDPTSAHLMRICRHVIAKRAVKAFLRQEMSVINHTEVALRDDVNLQRRPGSSRGSSRGSDRHIGGGGSSSGAGSYWPPIKAMEPELVEALAIYLKEGDQHMTVDELFLSALLAETEKDWKRAILLASACVVIDREFILATLLRARCCRRLGLWTQAIKDLSHAVLLRPDDYRLHLLRACLYSKTGDADNALTDVNRALALHPQSTDALLLRADILHRRRVVAAALQDLTTVLALDRSCWQAYYDRATLRLRAIEGEEQSLVYHWEHMRYEELLAAIIQDYVNALHKGCTLVEVVETVGDLTVRLLEYSGDVTVLRQMIQNLTRLLHLLVLDPSSSFSSKPRTPNSSGLGTSPASSANHSLSTLERELLVAAIHAQRGRLYVLSNDKHNALEDFDHAVVMEYHYPVAHFYRGAFATLVQSKDSSGGGAVLPKDAEAAAAHHANNLQHLSRCLALDPTIAGAYTVRGALHLRDLRFNNALQDFKAAVATDPTLSEVWLQIALVYLNHYHDCGECVKACSSALANDASLSRALYLRGEAYTRQGNLTAALCDYTRLTRAQPDDRWTHLMRGRLQLQLKMARPALYSFILFMEQGSVAADPVTSSTDTRTSRAGDKSKAGDGNKRALLLCGRAFQLLSRFQSAVRAFEQAVAENPCSENLVLLSESLHSLGDTENSLRVSEKVVSADPSSFRGYVRRAQLFVSVGQLSQAMAEYDKALALAPKEGRVCYERGVVQLQLYQHWRAAFQLNFASTSSSTTGPAHTTRRSPFAYCIAPREVEKLLGLEAMQDEVLVGKMMKQFFVGSVTDLSRCIRLEPLLADAYVDRAELNALGEEFDRAFRDLESAIERQPKCARAHVSLGVLKCQFASYAAAIDDFDKAIKCEAATSADVRACALFNRGVAYQKLGLWAQAERSYNQSIALASRGRDVAAYRNRAIVRCQLGYFDAALQDLEEVQQSAPDDDELHGALGFALLQLGRYEDAAMHFAAYGRLGRDTYVDSGNAHFNLATKSEKHLEKAQYAAYLQRARRFYLHAVRLHPSNADVRLNLANCLRKESAVRAAIAQCDVISRAHPLNHACRESKALALFQLPGHQAVLDAVACMDTAIRACIDSSSALENIFYAFTSGSIRRNALERKTISRGGARSNRVTVCPSKPSTLIGEGESESQEVLLTGSHEQMLALYMLNRGIMLEKLGEFARARQDFIDAMHFDPLSAHVHICLGTLSLREGKYTESTAELARAIDLDPSSGVAHLNLGVTYMCRSRLSAALSHFDAAIELLPHCSYAFANKAVALGRCGDIAEAEHYFKRAIEELPSQKEFYLARGKIVAQQKRLQDAMVDFSTALFLGYDGKL